MERSSHVNVLAAVVLLALSIASVSKVAAQTSEQRIGASVEWVFVRKVGCKSCSVREDKAGQAVERCGQAWQPSISMASVSASLPRGVDQRRYPY